MRRGYLRITLLVLSIGPASACAPAVHEFIVVIPDSGGRVGEVVVNDGVQEHALNTANAGLKVAKGAETVALQVTPEEIERVFGDALAAAPVQLTRFSIFFEGGTVDLTPESAAKLPDILADFRRRSTPEVEVLGHTDRVGTNDSNMELSLRRANFVRDWLVSNGVPGARITVAPRGEADLMVETADGVAEAKNRRVEITLR